MMWCVVCCGGGGGGGGWCGGGGGGGGGHSLILAIQLRATGQGMVFWPCCPKQGMQINLPLP